MSEPPDDSHAGRGDLLPGDALRDGRYAIAGKLGEGGQGTTFHGVDKREGRAVTIKRFRVRGASSWKEVELAEREAKVLAHVSHPHLPVYVDHFEEAGSLYLVTERIEGETVAALRAAGPMSEDDVLRFLHDAASALDYLHGRAPPLVHRDIKPSNVIRRPDGSFAIIDFGAVRDRLKVTGSTVVGTFGYMAPEQFQGRAMPASDVYAAGTTAIAMLTGLEPEDLPHKGLAIDVAAALGKTARPALVRALAAMVEPDPDKRAARLSTVIADLRPSPPGAARRDTRSSAPPDAARHETRGPEGGRRAPGWAADPDLQRAVDEAGDQVRRVAEELGNQVRRVVDDVTHGRIDVREIKREAHRAAEIARREARQAAEAARREARRARKEARRTGASSKRADRRGSEERPRPPGAPLGGPVLLVVLLGLSVAQLAVLLALRVVTPVVLYLVSFLFFGSIPGRALRTAAGHVSEAGKRAVASIGRARDIVRGRPVVDPAAPTVVSTVDHVDPHARTEVSTVGQAPPAAAASTVRTRIQDEASPAGVRVGDVPAPDEGDDARAAAEEEAWIEEQGASPDRRAR
jgi:hypothetical protein